jgi:polyhydroxyalkanoate synthase
MGLLEKFKSVFGGSDRGTASASGEPDVTVEYEPDAGSEHAVKGTDEAVDAGTSESVEAVKGIGPTYSERLGEAGVETVADLAGADAETVAEAAETSISRAEDWIERARNRT